MAKKHKHPEHENLERWLVSYADFITLLFATFTALYALSQSDLAKMKDVAEAISQGFQEQSLLNQAGKIFGDRGNPDKDSPVPKESGGGSGVLGQHESMTYRPGEVKAVEEAVKGLQADLTAMNQDIADYNSRVGVFGTPKNMEDPDAALRGVEVSVQERGIRISMDSRMLFGPGNATLRIEARRFLDKVARRIKPLSTTHMIHVEGHTDDIPISTAVFPSNWELSGARASSVIRYFTGRHGISPNALVAVGYGSAQPLTTNKTPEGRAQNRRVDIIVYSQRVSNQINPRSQFAREETLLKSVSSDGLSDLDLKPKPIEPKQAPDESTPRIIIKENDGTERVIVPKTTSVAPPKPSITPGH